MIAEKYFEETALRVFADYLGGLGMNLVEADETHLRYSGAHCFIEVFVLSDDGPKYSPRIEMGPLPELGVMSRDRQVDIMHTLPVSSPLRRYNLEWRYADAEEMEAVFVRARDQIFDVYARPLLSKHDDLIELVQERSKEISERWQEEIADHNDTIYRRNAAKAFAEKRYREFIHEISKIPNERLSATELKKLSYALRQAST
jgi:hypothetical protein